MRPRCYFENLRHIPIFAALKCSGSEFKNFAEETFRNCFDLCIGGHIRAWNSNRSNVREFASMRLQSGTLWLACSIDQPSPRWASDSRRSVSSGTTQNKQPLIFRQDASQSSQRSELDFYNDELTTFLETPCFSEPGTRR